MLPILSLLMLIPVVALARRLIPAEPGPRINVVVASDMPAAFDPDCVRRRDEIQLAGARLAGLTRMSARLRDGTRLMRAGGRQ